MLKDQLMQRIVYCNIENTKTCLNKGARTQHKQNTQTCKTQKKQAYNQTTHKHEHKDTKKTTRGGKQKQTQTNSTNNKNKHETHT